MSRGRRKKLAQFRRGATAIRQYIGVDGLYFCPLCTDGFSEDGIHTGQLTTEHVPIKSLGGRDLLLTCYECNNAGGIALEADLNNREKLRRFFATARGEETSYEGPATLESGGERLNVEMYRDGRFLVLADNNRRNDPAKVERMPEVGFLQGRVTAGVRYRPVRAAIGDLRAAYLAAFALLGYRYAFHPAFNPVREQIAKPQSKILDGFLLRLDPTAPVERRIFEVGNPHCVAVQLDRVAVLLPIPGSSDDLYERLALNRATNQRVELSDIDELGWPTGLELRQDFAEQSHLPFPSLLRGELQMVKP